MPFGIVIYLINGFIKVAFVTCHVTPSVFPSSLAIIKWLQDNYVVCVDDEQCEPH